MFELTKTVTTPWEVNERGRKEGVGERAEEREREREREREKRGVANTAVIMLFLAVRLRHIMVTLCHKYLICVILSPTLLVSFVST